jgi:hypothetical protein
MQGEVVSFLPHLWRKSGPKHGINIMLPWGSARSVSVPRAPTAAAPGKSIDLRCTTAGSTSPRFGHNGFAASCPLALLGAASYPVPVRRPAASLHASFTPASRSDALRFTSLAVTSLREDFHLQVYTHAGRTRGTILRSKMVEGAQAATSLL